MPKPRKNAAPAPAPAAAPAADEPIETTAALGPAAEPVEAAPAEPAGEVPTSEAPLSDDQVDAELAALTDPDPNAPPPADEKPDELLFAVPVPAYIHAIDLTDERRLPADLRQAVEGRLGCLFRMKAGKVTVADGRAMTMVVHPVDGLLGLFGKRPSAEAEPVAS
jgi:hypothetical protein